jgi:hypothetical protein
LPGCLESNAPAPYSDGYIRCGEETGMIGEYEAPELKVLGSVAELTLSNGFPCVIFPKPGGGGTVTKTIGATDHVFHTVHGQNAPLTDCSV